MKKLLIAKLLLINVILPTAAAGICKLSLLTN